VEVRLIFYTFRLIWIKFVGRDSTVGMATYWTVLTPNTSGGEIFGPRPERPEGSSGLLCNGYRVYSPGVKSLGCGLIHLPHGASRSKKE